MRRSIVFAAILFGASVVGMLLQWVVPAQILTEAKGTVGAMVGPSPRSPDQYDDASAAA